MNSTSRRQKQKPPKSLAIPLRTRPTSVTPNHPLASQKPIAAIRAASLLAIFAGFAIAASQISTSAELADLANLPSHPCPFGTPISAPSPTSAPSLIIVRPGYALAYSTDSKIALWVHEALEASDLRGPATRSRCSFRPDPLIPFNARAQLADYRRCGFDRGHLAPAADFAYDQRRMQDSFFLSNVAPQIGPGFNRSLWADLEQRARKSVPNEGVLHVITGPVFDPKIPPKKIGRRAIPVPTAFFKVLLSGRPAETPRVIAILIPHRPFPPIPRARSNLSPFVLSVDELEVLTNLNFFPDLDALDPALEAALESRTPPLWLKLR